MNGLAGEDHYLGTEGVRPILEGILVLLNGPCGDLNRGAMDEKIRDLAVRIKMIPADTREF